MTGPPAPAVHRPWRRAAATEPEEEIDWGASIADLTAAEEAAAKQVEEETRSRHAEDEESGEGPASDADSPFKPLTKIDPRPWKGGQPEEEKAEETNERRSPRERAQQGAAP